MADYNRFISYIYSYENGRKTANTGFAKVENRNGQCRYSIVIKNIYGKQDRSLKAYMFVRKENRNIEILIGDLSIKNNQGELSGLTSVSGLSGTEYTLEDVSGIVVAEDEKIIYGTCWDDEPLDIHRFFMGSGESHEGEVEAAQVEDALLEEADEDALDMTAMFPVVEPEDDTVRELEAVPALEPDEMDVPVKDPEETSVPEMEPELEPEQPEPVAEPAETESETNADMEPEPVEERLSVEEPPREQEMFMEPGDNLGEEPDFNTYMEQDEVAASKAADSAVRKASGNDIGEMIGRALQMCPRMFPFDDDEVVSCVRFEPQDIGRLPIKFWMYGSNSFLLHGYYAYRHLILAQTKEEEGEASKYILGVPGLNHSREAFMANMFGFRLFKPVCASTAGVCDFGYWYVVLE